MNSLFYCKQSFVEFNLPPIAMAMKQATTGTKAKKLLEEHPVLQQTNRVKSRYVKLEEALK